MTVDEMKEYLAQLPPSAGKLPIVLRSFHQIDGEFWAFMDKPSVIAGLGDGEVFVGDDEVAAKVAELNSD